jgi:hypothetical protein
MIARRLEPFQDLEASIVGQGPERDIYRHIANLLITDIFVKLVTLP